MRHHIHNPVGGLIPRERHCELGVHHSETGTEHHRITNRYFLMSLFVGDHGISTPFRTGGRDCQHHSHRKRFLRRSFSAIEIPEIACIGHTQCHTFRCINRRTASYCQKEIHTLGASLLYSGINTLGCGIRLYAAEFNILYPFFRNGIGYLFHKSVALDAVGAIDDHHFGSAISFQRLPCLFLGPLSEYEFCWGIIYKVFHLCTIFLEPLTAPNIKTYCHAILFCAAILYYIR